MESKYSPDEFFSAERKPDHDDLEELIDRSLAYQRAADMVKTKKDELLREFRALPDPADEAALETARKALSELEKSYEAKSTELWTVFERDAATANEDTEPFYGLLAAIFRGMVGEFKSCAAVLRDPAQGMKETKAAAARFKWLVWYFSDTTAGKILDNMTPDKDALLRRAELFS